MSELQDTNYQTIFIGHSLGGALATIASFYYANYATKYTFKSEPILITFGQPRVGNQLFAEYLTNNINQIYRIVRPKDPVTQIPLYTLYSEERKKLLNSIINAVLLDDYGWLNPDNLLASFYLKLGVQMFEFLIKYKLKNLVHTHIGGLYIIDDNKKKIYLCSDFYNENTEHFICKNNDLNVLTLFKDLVYHNYFIDSQNMLNQCQENKDLHFFVFSYSRSLRNNNSKKLSINYYNYHSYRYLIENENYEKFIQDIKIIKSNEEFYFEKNISEIWFQYTILGSLQKDDLILKINPEYSLFFGTLCFSQNINSILSHDNENSDSCIFINTKNIISYILEIEEISNINTLYIHSLFILCLHTLFEP